MEFYDRPVLLVARDLLGMILVRVPGVAFAERGGSAARIAGRIVEVEAYDGEADLACHASKGRTERTEPMFGPAGRAYVYLVYGMHHCLNVVTGPVGHPAAVLLRALEPLEETEWMERGSGPPATIAAGPGRLTRALGIDLSHNRADLRSPGELFIEAGEPVPDNRVLRGPRIGVEYAGAWARKPWRLGVRGSSALSRPFPKKRTNR
jgi:DNA-3-methyladenine glycosylase